MQENLPTAETVSERNCASCGQPAMVGDHRTPLCSDCRAHFTRLSIPLWIRLFAGGIALVLLFSLFTLPASISMGVHLEKGKRAEKERNFLTAERELSKVLEKAPDNVEARGHLLIAAFHNQDFETFSGQLNALQNVNIEDKELYNDIGKVMMRAGHYISNDSFENFRKNYPDMRSIPDTAWERYLRKNAEDCFAVEEYASLLFDRKDYHRCDIFLQLALRLDDEYFPALMMEASVKREEGDLDGAMHYSDRMLNVNKESIYGMSSKARTFLRQKRDAPGLELALKGYAMDDKNLYSVSTLILAYHFNGRMKERDALVKVTSAAKLDSTDREKLQYALDVIDKKEKFRD